MNNLPTVVWITILAICLISMVAALVAANYAHRCGQWMATNNKRSRVLKQLTDIETEMTEHADSIGQLHVTMKKLRSRVGMRELAARRKNGESDGIPDSKTEPAAWKAYMRRKLKENQ